MAGSVGNITTDIIKNGLVFNMDAANRASYPKTGTTVTETTNLTTGSWSDTGKDTGNTVNDGNWKNVVATYDGTNARFYHNSQLSSTVSVSNTVASNSATYPLRIGASNNAGPNRLLLGRIGPSQIYNRALSASEVLHNYNALKGRFGL